jgi:hypothetical protein
MSALAVKSTKAMQKNRALLQNEVLLSEEDIKAIIDSYAWTNCTFVSKSRISNKGKIVESNGSNEVFVIDKSTKRIYTLSSLGKIFSVGSGLVLSEYGIFKVIFDTSGARFERIEVNPKYKVVNIKQDIFGNIYVGVTNAPPYEEVYFTSDGCRVSVYNRNALLALGTDRRLYFLAMDGSYDIKKGRIEDLKVLNRDGSLVGVKPKLLAKVVHFEDFYDAYGICWFDGNYLCLDNGYMYFNCGNKQTYILPSNAWLLSDKMLAITLNDGNLYKVGVNDLLGVMAQGFGVDSIRNKMLLVENVDKVYLQGNNLEATSLTSKTRFVIPLSDKILARTKIRPDIT